VIGALLLMPQLAAADPLKIAWDPNPEPTLLGYVVHVATASGGATHSVDVGPALTYTHLATPGVTYYVSVSAYGTDGTTSARSTEIAAMVPVVPLPPLPPTTGVPGIIPQGGWRLHFVSSQELTAEKGAAIYAFDGKASTIWHSAYKRTVAQPPHTMDIDLGATYAIAGFRYLPRQDGKTNGRIANYEFYVSADGVTWGSQVAAGTLLNVAQAQEVRFTAKPGRFIRLRALTEVNGRAYASMAEINVFGSLASTTPPPTALAPTGLSLHSVSSEETSAELRLGRHAFDGDPATFWHNRWSVNPAPPPHDIQINLGTTYPIAGVRYMPRQDGSTNGRVARYEVYVSADGATWGTPAASGTLGNVGTAQDILFQPLNARYLRFRALSEVSGRTYGSMAELTVLRAP
jgi:endo-alpha-N-acetylgalactosaminidase